MNTNGWQPGAPPYQQPPSRPQPQRQPQPHAQSRISLHPGPTLIPDERQLRQRFEPSERRGPYMGSNRPVSALPGPPFSQSPWSYGPPPPQQPETHFQPYASVHLPNPNLQPVPQPGLPPNHLPRTRPQSAHRKQPHPQPQPEPRPPRRLFTAPDILTRASAELAPLKRSLQSLVAHEFSLPRSAAIPISLHLTPADYGPAGKWAAGRGWLWRETGRSIWTPSVVMELAALDVPASSVRAAAQRVVSALLVGSLPDHPPLPARGELRHCSFAFRGADGGACVAMPPGAYVYLPDPGRVRDAPLYERLEKEGVDARARVKDWAGRWLVPLDS
ncbi:hypothetical protein F4804DRAFT_350143 [Jackrogersella minutella]|nr:hypothetical protein F4804DRAFT_350143 [Jackrogersella minutella]